MNFYQGPRITPAMVDECARAVLHDAELDGEVTLTYEPAGDPLSNFGCLIYPGTARPEPPYALHEPFREYTWREFTPSHADEADVLGFMASEVQTLVQLGRWAAGLDPTWPPCEVHAGRHPLNIRYRSRNPEAPEPGVFWACTAHAFIDNEANTYVETDARAEMVDVGHRRERAC